MSKLQTNGRCLFDKYMYHSETFRVKYLQMNVLGIHVKMEEVVLISSMVSPVDVSRDSLGQLAKPILVCFHSDNDERWHTKMIISSQLTNQH